MVLAAGGETLWHANSAAAAPRVKNFPIVGTAPLASIGAARSTASSVLTTPDFKPLVFVPLEPRPGGGSPLELDTDGGVHINADGDVVATFIDNGDSNIYFWRDSGLSNGTSTLAGWQGPLKDEYGTAIVGSASGINAATDIGICGTHDVSGTDTAFYYEFDNLDDREGTLYDIGSGYGFDISENGVVVGTSLTGISVAWSDTIGSPVPLPPLTTGGNTGAYGVDPDSSGYPHIVGASEDVDSYVQAVSWYKDTSWHAVALSSLGTVAQYSKAADINADLHAIGSTYQTSDGSVLYSHLWVYSSGPSWTQEDISDVGMATAINNQTYPEVVGYDPDTPLSAKLWVATDLAHSTFDGVTLDLADMTIGLPDDLLDLQPTDINDAGEIVGMAKIDAETDYWIPFKIVPYDTNNNGEPDYRDIIQDPTNYPDTSPANWLIDKSETLRVGMYAAGFNPENTLADQVELIQAVRLHLDSDDIAYVAHNTGGACEGMGDALEAWRQSEDQKEIIAMIRVKYTNTHYDYIPTGQDKEDYLDDLFCFAYRYAKDIDFIQFGNEISGGPGECWIDTTGCTDSGLGSHHGTCLPQAWDDVLAWMEVQIAVARMGSALGGRPLRFITPAATRWSVLIGKDGDLSNSPDFDDPVDFNPDREAYNIKRLIDFGNEQQAWIDLHLHYDIDGDLEEAISAFVAPPDNTWEVPHFKTCMEWSPVPTDQWAEQNSDEFVKYFWEEDGDPAAQWDSFVYDWGEDDVNGGLGRTGFPNFSTDLTEMESAGFLHAMYGEFDQGDVPWQDNGEIDPPGPPLPEKWDLTVLRANEVLAQSVRIADTTYLFTELKSDLKTEILGGGFKINGFAPHDSAPTTSCEYIPRPR